MSYSDNDDNEDRKRGYDHSDSTNNGLANSSGGNPIKRLRPEEILGSTDDYRKATTRLMVGKVEFAKIIGKGGVTLKSIRSNNNADIKGSDINEDLRVVIITGNPRPVLDTFDTISEIIRQAQIATGSGGEIVKIEFLIEPAKVGKIVGVKGGTIHSLQAKAGVKTLRIQKDSQDVSGVTLQSLLCEGSLNSCRRLHYALLELFVDPAVMSQIGGSGSSRDHDILPPQISSLSLRPPVLSTTPSRYTTPLPLQTLTNYGVLPDTVQQLQDMKIYLSRQFGLDLSIFLEPKEESVSNYRYDKDRDRERDRDRDRERDRSRTNNDRERVSNAEDIVFQIPKESVGAVIGKGGHVLKELNSEFGLKVHIDKDDQGVIRNVTINGTNQYGVPQDRSVMLKCKEKILKIVQNSMVETDNDSKY